MNANTDAIETCSANLASCFGLLQISASESIYEQKRSDDKQKAEAFTLYRLDNCGKFGFCEVVIEAEEASFDFDLTPDASPAPV